MYERMLDKNTVPTFEDLLEYSGNSKDLWQKLDKHLNENYVLTKQIRFPYGNNYGWSVKYSQKGKQICDAFAEKGAFSAHFQIRDDAFLSISDSLTDYSKNVYDNKYPCKSGGWLTYRVLSDEHLQDLMKLLQVKSRVPRPPNS